MSKDRYTVFLAHDHGWFLQSTFRDSCVHQTAPPFKHNVHMFAQRDYKQSSTKYNSYFYRFSKLV